MAKTQQQPADVPRALLSMGGVQIVLPVDEAVQAFRLLCAGETVEYDWNTRQYKRATGSSTRPELKMFTFDEYAAMLLNSTD